MQDLNISKRTTQVLGVLSSNVVFKMLSLKKTGSCESPDLNFKRFCVKMISKSPIIEPVVFLSLKYIQRYIKKGNNINITNEYQLFTIALMVANKWHNDEVYAKKVWSEISGISQVDIDSMEISFLKSLNFKMHITESKYAFWLNCLKKHNLTGKLEYLFAKKIKKTTASQENLPKLGFNFDAKIIQPPVGFERSLMISKSPIIEPVVFLSLKYIQRYIKKGNNINITNEYQLFTIALMVANKWHNDEVYAKKVWSEISGISQVDIDSMEISFLKSLNFKMHITESKYAFWLNCLKKHNLTGKLEYLFAKKIKKTTASQENLPKLGFNFDAKIIQPPVGFERSLVISHYAKEYKLFE
ncbi:hypothetical protein Glove_309g107 [Diversispora epigaea]|uniref:Cyclin N-terminal domain-containing protein n=1 Tax=Diversispora epigaea TaxID=1348612 RepID=A0A397HX04_9GLOM|nr:hypothetical protein Glove_309g107 [Diversispora epigaea]